MTGDKERPEINELISRYLRNECSPEELEQLSGYFKEYGLPEQELENDPLFHPHEEQSHKMYAHLLGKLSLHNNTNTTGRLGFLPQGLRMARVAAVLLPLLVIGSLYLLLHRQKNSYNAQLRNTATTARYLRLPDGTEIWLNKGAALQWNNTDFAGRREVALLGEAWFDVAPDQAHPFTVISGGLKTKVLGTSFDLQSDSAAQTAVVTLVTGKVALTAKNTPEKILLPGQAAVYDDKANTLKSIAIPFYAFTWKTGELVCDTEPMDSIIDYISLYYHTPIRLSSNIRGLKFTGTISLKDNLSAVLDRLLFVHQLHYKTTGTGMLIY